MALNHYFNKKKVEWIAFSTVSLVCIVKGPVINNGEGDTKWEKETFVGPNTFNMAKTSNF